jgi:ATP-binding cassette subfamily B protein/subfamily B ATP-binding cassette protein MsbA
MAELPEERAAQRGVVAGRLWQFLRPFRSQLVLVLVLTLLSAAAQAVGPMIIGMAIDTAIQVGNGARLNWLMLALLVTYIVGSSALRLQFMRMGEIGQRTLANMRAEIFAAIQRLSLSFFDRQPAGDLMSRLTNDTDVLNQLMGQGLVQVLGSMFGLVGILVAMLGLDWRLALISFSTIPVMLLLTSFFSRTARRAFRRTRESLGDVSAEIQEEIAGVRVAQAFSRTAVNQQRFQQRNAANRDANVSATAITSAFTPTIDLLATIATAIVAGYGGYLVLNSQASVGTVIAFLTYVQIFFRPIQALASFYTTAQAALAAAERIFALIDAPVELTDSPDARQMPPIVGKVEFEHVSFSYGARPTALRHADEAHALPEPAAHTNGAAHTGQLAEVPAAELHPVEAGPDGDPAEVLSDVSLLAEPGQTIAIVGPTGAGKTTLVNLIGRFYDVKSGALRIDDIDVRSVTRASLRSQMGVVLQDSFLFSGTIADNIRYGRLDASDAQVEAAARAANAHEFVERLPEGYATVIGERGSTLSLGQRQLIGIARAILADPRILILDEATSSIDTRTEMLIQDALRTLLRGRTSFVIAHRLSTIRDADQVLVLQHGHLIERGTHEQLLAHGGLYAELYRRQFRDVPVVQDERRVA